MNDVEDAEDDYYDSKKRKRNPIASGELTKKQGYLIGFSFLFIGLSLLLTISYLVFLVGFTLISVGIIYSWKPIRLKSIPIIDLFSHAIALGVLQFSITYLAFRPFGLQFISCLMMIMPLSVAVSILQQLRDCKVDEKAKINNTIQKFGKFDPRKLIAGLITISLMGVIIICTTLNPTVMFIFLLTCLSAAVFLRLDKFFKLKQIITE